MELFLRSIGYVSIVVNRLVIDTVCQRSLGPFYIYQMGHDFFGVQNLFLQHLIIKTKTACPTIFFSYFRRKKVFRLKY